MMLVLTRRIGETVLINHTIRVTVLSVRANTVRIGFLAPDDVAIYREELLECLADNPAPTVSVPPARINPEPPTPNS